MKNVKKWEASEIWLTILVVFIVSTISIVELRSYLEKRATAVVAEVATEKPRVTETEEDRWMASYGVGNHVRQAGETLQVRSRNEFFRNAQIWLFPSNCECWWVKDIKLHSYPQPKRKTPVVAEFPAEIRLRGGFRIEIRRNDKIIGAWRTTGWPPYEPRFLYLHSDGKRPLAFFSFPEGVIRGDYANLFELVRVPVRTLDPTPLPIR